MQRFKIIAHRFFGEPDYFTGVAVSGTDIEAA
ncbi:hypothetical protein SDC9_191313 [bioreactor metagenome]|uniref:Uncharacterized protein n=1 Tax=bioreactor metagenome TaxID=1076179 RepID=A0A645I8L6_9ZZZZ